ncbi:MAG: DUF47 family protein [Candidatus Accumulibacter sp.]|jgi:uncharacterized protein Yka (UPF0111/DUF47 family)|uniref:DUF47 domain-containing protein n=1 Tax=Accumulibacter sp. TaxID=2053492 RepID=UPI001A5750AC|nr:DUF47 family protein [Accumulibacter sp.]MBL8395222.1 DUF47 family protein [Accumulibacter sp.]
MDNNQDEDNKPIFRRLYERVFPTVADFFGMLAEQSSNAAETTRLLVEFMETGDVTVAQRVRDDEHEADRIKAANLSVLSDAFSTPIDREDLFRAITTLDDIVNYCKSTVVEMDMLGLQPDKHSLEIALHIREGTEALAKGFARLATDPAGAGVDANAARKAERTVEKSYRRAITALFQGDDYLNMFKRRETYRHLSNAADRVADAARALDNIVVKLC